MKVQLISGSGNKAMCLIKTDHGVYTRHLIKREGKWYGVPAVDNPPLDKETRKPNVFVVYPDPKSKQQLDVEEVIESDPVLSEV